MDTPFIKICLTLNSILSQWWCRGATIKHEGWFVNTTQTLLRHSRFSFYNRHNTAQAKKKNKNSPYLIRRTWPIATWRNLQCNLTTEVREAGGTDDLITLLNIFFQKFGWYQTILVSHGRISPPGSSPSSARLPPNSLVPLDWPQ